MRMPRIPLEIRFAHSDNELLMRRDLIELKKCAKHDLYKSVMLLAGSVVECALMDFLVRQEDARKVYNRLYGRTEPVNEWKLSQMLEVARDLGILRTETYKLCDLIRDYRNLIHPAVEKRMQLKPDMERALRSVQGMAECLNDLERACVSRPRNVVIIDIKGLVHRGVDSYDAAARAVKAVAEAQGHTVEVLDSLARLEELINNPTRETIIVNLHGELVPTPSSFSGKWRDYFLALAQRVRDQGWILVSVAGYPFWAYDQNIEIRDAGLDVFLSVVNASADCMNPSKVDFTEYGRKVLNRFNMKGLPHSIGVSRCAVWNGIKPYRVFLRSDGKCGASAVKIGYGYFLQSGFIDGEDMKGIDPETCGTILGNLAIAFALSI